MPGIYIHIPFCKKACHYCDFHFSTNLKRRGEMLEALQREIWLRRDYLGGEELATIYIGGGTPSLLSPAELSALLETIGKFHPLAPSCEITLEANPDDLETANLAELRKTGINRLSIGVQSFFDEDLRWMNRAHTAAGALESIRRARNAGFDNLTADLIYGFPLLSDLKWLENIRTAIDLGIEHLSCYNLTVEEGTALSSFIKKGQEQNPSGEQGARQFELLMDETARNGFLHYEISNFCRPGFHSRHNTAYWQEKAYLGIGPSAHSYNGRSRSWNKSNNYAYIQAIGLDELPSGEESLTVNDRVNERIMTQLRTMWGLDLEKIAEDFGNEVLSELQAAAGEYTGKGWAEEKGGKLYLTRKGKLYADSIISGLFLV
ncbi:radical SAM family heme chaperone HemW [Anseongella ginsenosidimutans]|nr:radical SAM family heme chaperone HemW [Anseongella ginsenosidimutans]